MRKPASREIISASVELCGTESFSCTSNLLARTRVSVWAESAIRKNSLKRTSALGLLRRLLAIDVVNAEGLDDGAGSSVKTRGNGR